MPARDPYLVGKQQLLIELGFNVGPAGADGYDGPDTQAALTAIKAALKLKPKPTRHQCAACLNALSQAISKGDLTPDAMAMLWRDFDALCGPFRDG